MQEHEPTVDKDGNDVSRFIAEAVEAIRQHPRVGKVLCDYHATGRLQVFFVQRYVRGAVVRLAREHGYQLDHASERSGETVEYPSWDKIGYMELVPVENDPDTGNDYQIQ